MDPEVVEGFHTGAAGVADDLAIREINEDVHPDPQTRIVHTRGRVIVDVQEQVRAMGDDGFVQGDFVVDHEVEEQPIIVVGRCDAFEPIGCRCRVDLRHASPVGEAVVEGDLAGGLQHAEQRGSNREKTEHQRGIFSESYGYICEMKRLEMNRRQSTWMLHFIVLIFGFTGILGKLIEVEAMRVVFWRVLLGGGLVAVFLLLTGRLKRLRGRSLWQVALVGCIAGAHWVTFFQAIKVSNVSVALATLASAPLFVGLVEPVVHRRRVDWREIVLALVISAGLMLIIFAPSGAETVAAHGGNHFAGVAWALVSAFLAAVFSTLNSVLVRAHDSANLTRVEMLAAAAGLALIFAVRGELWTPAFWQLSAMDWLWIGLLATLATAFAYLMSIEVMRQLTPFTTAMAINMEPVYAILLSAWIFGESERMGPWFYLGACVVIGAVGLDAWLKRRARRR